jgi:excisionase family DNA binding protein
MIVMEGEEFLTAQEACTMLGIKTATLYAYVSRGLLPSYRQGIKRTRLYRRDDVDRLTRLRGPDERDDEYAPPVPGAPGAWIPYV